MDWIQPFYLIGSIGLFLYGLKLMSEGLQKIAVENLRNIHASIKHNRFTAMLSGVLITALVLSSSTTMVMTVSFVNGGLITLAESLAVAMGANLGTTLTTWIIAALGFKFNIAYLVFPIIAIALPLFQSNNTKRNSWGELLIGFALLFIGLEVLKDNVATPSQFPALQTFFDASCSYGYGSAFIYLLLGIGLTLLVQASSITYAIAILMCANGWITFEMGCAMLLGTNLGCCLSPLQAARTANVLAKRSAWGFIAFNALGTLWAMALIFVCCDLVSEACILIGIGNPDNLANISIGLALFYTIYNIVNILLMLPLAKQIVKLLSKGKEKEQNVAEDSFKLQYLSKGLVMKTGQMALIQVQKETSRYASQVYKMFEMLMLMINEPLGSERQMQLHQQISKMEEDSDAAEIEIANFLNQVSHTSLSWQGELISRNLYKMVDELESIADSIMHMSTTLINKQEQRIFFSQEMNTDIRRMLSLTDTSLAHMCHMLALDEIPTNALNKAYNNEDEINNYRNQLRSAMLERIDLQQIEYMQSTYFMMLVNECEKIGDYAINVVAAACEANQ